MNIISKLAAAKTEAEVQAIVAKEFEAKKQSAGNAKAIAAVRDYMFGGEPMAQAKGLGKTVNPLVVPEVELKALHQAAVRKQNYRTVEAKSFATVDGLLPPQLQPGIVGPVFEHRLMDQLPTTSISAPTLRYIKHTSTSGTPAITAEGAAKPELEPTFTDVDVTALKIAAWTSASHESLQDYEGFLGYVTTDLLKRIVSVENNELLVQTGTTGHMNGLINQAGLTHARPSTLTSGHSTETSLDALESSIAAMRAGSELCTPDLFVIHPTTWSIIRTLKDTLGRYLFANADGTDAAVNTIFGVPVFVTTDMPTGKGLFVNNGFGYVVVREGLNVFTDAFSASTNNITKFIGEERLNVAVERPNRLLAVTNLATDSSDA
jgi:HK97 family phage major capsid protein